jgi:hypothetical protein
MPDLFGRIRSLLRSATGRKSGPEMYRTLRSMALRFDPSEVEVPDDTPWSGALMAIMEIGLPDGTATLVAIADGSVSMYFSTGAAVIGAGEHAAVRGAAERFRLVASESRHLLQRSEDFPLPDTGQVRFHVRTIDGMYSNAVTEALLRSGRHALATLYNTGQDLITEVRMAAPE